MTTTPDEAASVRSRRLILRLILRRLLMHGDGAKVSAESHQGRDQKTHLKTHLKTSPNVHGAKVSAESHKGRDQS